MKEKLASPLSRNSLSRPGSPLGRFAAVHTRPLALEETDWIAIVSLYDSLTEICPSPIVALNRAIAIAQHEGPERGIEELQAVADSERLANYPFYHAALGKFELRRGNNQAVSDEFRNALAQAQPNGATFLEQHVETCGAVSSLTPKSRHE